MKRNTITSKNNLGFKLAAVALAVLGLSAVTNQAYAVDAPVLAQPLWYSWQYVTDEACSSYSFEAGHGPANMFAENGGSDTGISEIPNAQYKDTGAFLYPGSFMGWWFHGAMTDCWTSYTAIQPTHTLEFVYSDWGNGSYGDIKGDIIEGGFGGEYEKFGTANMNSHGNDNDEWDVKYVNRTKSPIFLHYLGEQKWNAPNAPTDYEIPACTTYEMPATNYAYDYNASDNAYTGGWNGASGDLTYAIGGAYTGRVHMIGNYPEFIRAVNGQSISGSSDAIWLEGLPLCKQGSDGQLEQSYGCVTSTFDPPKNVASSLYTGGHGHALRRFSSNVAAANYADVIFQPRDPTDTCPLDKTGLTAYLQRHLPDIITTHPDKFTLADHANQTFKQVYPTVSAKKMTGGLFVTSWGTNGSSIPPVNIDGDNTKITFPTPTVYGPLNVIASSTSKLTNNTGMIETLTSVSFSRTVNTTTSATTTTGWSNTLGGGGNSNRGV